MYRLSFLLCLLLAVVNRSSAQPPAISYGDYKIFTKDSVINLLKPVNTGGAVPIRLYSQTSTFAGQDASAFIDGKGKAAGFNYPSGIALDKDGNIYVADEKNNSIRKISAEGNVITIAGKGFNGPSGLVADNLGNIYVADCFNHMIKKILPSGLVITLAGSGQAGDFDNSIGSRAMFRYPVSLALDKKGNVYVADEGNNKIRKISPDGSVSTFAGNGIAGSADHANGKLAGFSQPNGIALDHAGNLYVADQLNHKIRKISPGGSVSTFAGTGMAGSANHFSPTLASFNHPRGIALDEAGNVYVGDVGNQQIRKIDLDGEVRTFAGSGAAGSSDHNNGLLATFYFPNSMAIDKSGIMYIADCLNNKIRKIEMNGYRILPEIIPEGLHFDPATGVFSGTPAEFSPGAVYHITAYNTQGSSTAPLGIAISSEPGNALDLDAFDDHITIPDNAGLSPATITVEMWVNVKSFRSEGRFLVKRNSLNSYDDSYSIGLDSSGHFRAVMASGTGLKGSQAIARHQTKAELGRWYFLAAVFSKDSVNLFVNGELQAAVPSGFPISRGHNALSLGFDGSVACLIDELRIFNTNRSAAIASDMHHLIQPETSGLVAYYNFNLGRAGRQNTGFSTLYDLSPNANHGRLQNFSTLTGNSSNWVESYAMVVPLAKEAEEVSENSFTAKWRSPGFGIAENYFLDVSENALFESFLEGYQGKRLEDNSEVIIGLRPGTRYYYRLSAGKNSAEGQGAYSATVSVKTSETLTGTKGEK